MAVVGVWVWLVGVNRGWGWVFGCCGGGVVVGGGVWSGVLPVGVEGVYLSERTRVTRLVVGGRRVVRKEPLGSGWERRLRRELGVVERLRGVVGVVQLADVAGDGVSLLFEDVGGVGLAGVGLPLGAGELVGVAVGLAGAVAGMHGRGVMHRDIGPGNVLLCGASRWPCLVDFALASSFAEVRPEFTHHSEIVGTLAYLAPEATGRVGWVVDQRADLYALGATLYELATGGPPFGVGDALRLTHEHLARVPVAPVVVNAAVPAGLSEIIMHLLEKEPDRRYQTAEGLLHDLGRLGEDPPPHDVSPWDVSRAGGGRRRGARRRATRRGWGRMIFRCGCCRRRGWWAGTGRLRGWGRRLRGRCRGVAGGCWCVARRGWARRRWWMSCGRWSRRRMAGSWRVSIDQFRRDQDFDGVLQAFRGLGRLLLAEPEEELAELRVRMRRGLGVNAGLVSAVVPELAVLLGVAPDPGDPLTAQVRAQQTAVQILRAVVSRKRPMVLVIDDLQWAGRTPLGVIDMVLGAADLDGLLVVGAYRQDDLDAVHPLTGMLARWARRPDGPELIELANLPAAGQAAMVADMLRLDVAAAAGLAQAIAPHAHGNPYDTVELLNTLRHHGLLTPAGGRWRWDPAAISGYLAHTDVAGLLAERTQAMPGPTRAMLQAMACLGGRVELSLLQTATGEPPDVVEQTLAPALDDGLLISEPGPHETVRFRHDRIRETILRHLDPPARQKLELGMARRLAATPELFAVAAQQYLPVLDTITDPDEQHTVTGLLRHAAAQATQVANHPLAEKLLTGALQLTGPLRLTASQQAADPAQRATLIELHTAHHAALYSLGRLDEADHAYTTIDALCTNPVERAEATTVQISSLTNRNHNQQAVNLGAELLRQLGTTVPTPHNYPPKSNTAYTPSTTGSTTPPKPTTSTNPKSPTQCCSQRPRYSNRHCRRPTSLDQDDADRCRGWLCEAVRILAEHGPGPTLIGPAATVSLATIGDAAGLPHRLSRGTADPGVGRSARLRARHLPGPLLFALSSQWFEPLEDSLAQGQRAREGLIQGGDLAYAGYTYQIAVPQLFDCTPTLDSYVTKRRVRAGLRQTHRQRTGLRVDRNLPLAGGRTTRRERGDRAADDAVVAGTVHQQPTRRGLRTRQSRAGRGAVR